MSTYWFVLPYAVLSEQPHEANNYRTRMYVRYCSTLQYCTTYSAIIIIIDTYIVLTVVRIGTVLTCTLYRFYGTYICRYIVVVACCIIGKMTVDATNRRAEDRDNTQSKTSSCFLSVCVVPLPRSNEEIICFSNNDFKPFLPASFTPRCRRRHSFVAGCSCNRRSSAMFDKTRIRRNMQVAVDGRHEFG